MKTFPIYKTKVIEVIDGDTFRGEVEVKLHGTEKYGRSLVEVILPDNKDYTTLMINEGFTKKVAAKV